MTTIAEPLFRIGQKVKTQDNKHSGKVVGRTLQKWEWLYYIEDVEHYLKEEELKDASN